MLTRAELLAIAERQDGQKILTAYIAIAPGTATPLTAGRALLRQGVSRIRATLTSASHLEHAAFDAAAARMSVRLDRELHRQGAGTWVGFASADGTVHSEMLDAVGTSDVAWDDRMHVAPYLALTDDRTALVAVVSRDHATFYRFAMGALTELEHFETIANVDVPPHMGAPARDGFHTGTLGATATDAAARQIADAVSRHETRVAQRLGALDNDAWLVLAGAHETAAHIAQLLPRGTDLRLAVLGAFEGSPTNARVREAVARAVTKLRAADDAREVRTLLDRVHASARAVASAEDIDRALTQGAVRELVMTRSWTESHAAAAEDEVRRALAQDAALRIVDGNAADALDGAGGRGAVLRFDIGEAQPARGGGLQPRAFA